MVKEYVNKSGYRIKASEKAYNQLYRKNGFLPVDEVEAKSTNMGEGLRDEMSPGEKKDVTSGNPSVDAGEKPTTEKPKKAPTGKRAPAGSPRKTSPVQNAAGQSGDGEESSDVEKAFGAVADQDATGQSEGDNGRSGDGEIFPDAESVKDVAADQDAPALATETSEDK